MHTMYYANEVRDFSEIPKPQHAKLSEQELTLGANLIEQMADEFDPGKYHDEYRIRVLAMLENKSKGQEIRVTSAPEPRRGQVIDLMQALKQSMEQARPTRKAATPQKKRKTAS
jgi:DNA end-binding protein Ku